MLRNDINPNFAMDKVSVNPFIHRLSLSFADKVKVFIATITIFPLRVVLCLLFLVLAWVVSRLNFTILKLFRVKDVKQWSSVNKVPIIFLLRMVFFAGGFHLVNIIDKTKRSENKERKPSIIVTAPHSAMTDILPYIQLGAPSVVAKEDAQFIPFFGTFLMLTDPILVQRESEASRQKTIEDIKTTATEREIFIFPEGTCTNRSALLQFKLGAFRPGLPVQPIAIRYNIPDGLDTVTWTWDGPGGLRLIYLLLCKWNHSMDIIKLPYYSPSKEEIENPRLFADNVRDVIGKELGILGSFYSYDDVIFMEAAKKSFLPLSPVCVKFLKIAFKISMEMQSQACEKIKKDEGKENLALPLLHQNVQGVQLRRRPNSGVIGNSVKSKNPTVNKTNEEAIEVFHGMVSYSLRNMKLLKRKDMLSKEDLVDVLELEQYPLVCKSASIDELFCTLGRNLDVFSSRELYALLLLCDLSKPDGWQRIQDFFEYITGSKSPSGALSIKEFRLFLWYFLGFEAIDEQYFKGIPITFEYVKRNLITIFRQSVEENAPFLVETQSPSIQSDL